MLGKPLAAAVTLALLFCGATVSLEAVGLLFHVGVPDPQQRVEAFVARLEADLSPVDLPTEPVEFPVEIPAEVEEGVPRADAENVAPAEPMQDNQHQAAEIQNGTDPDQSGGEALTAAVTAKIPSPLPVAAPPAAPEIAAPESEAGARALPAQQAGPQELAPVSAQRAPEFVGQATAVAPTAQRRGAGADRSKRVHARMRPRPAGYAALGWPVLDWLVW